MADEVIWPGEEPQKKSLGFGLGTPAQPQAIWPGEPKEQETTNPVTGLVKGLYTGTVFGLPEQLAQATQRLGIGGETAEKVREWTKQPEKEKGWFEQAGEMIPLSVGVPIATHVLGTAMQAIPGLQIPGLALKLAGRFATPAIFGLAQSQTTLESAKEHGLSSEDAQTASYITGGIEWAGETAANVALGNLFGPLAAFGKTSKDMIGKLGAETAMKGTIGAFLKKLALVTAPTEILTEMGQNFGEAYVERMYGARPEAQPWEEAKGAIGPTAIMTAIIGGVGQSARKYVAAKQAQILSQPVDPNDPNYEALVGLRKNIADGVTEIIPEENKDLRGQWTLYAHDAIDKNMAIDITSPMDTLSMQIAKQMTDLEPEYQEAVKPPPMLGEEAQPPEVPVGWGWGVGTGGVRPPPVVPPQPTAPGEQGAAEWGIGAKPEPPPERRVPRVPPEEGAGKPPEPPVTPVAPVGGIGAEEGKKPEEKPPFEEKRGEGEKATWIRENFERTKKILEAQGQWSEDMRPHVIAQMEKSWQERMKPPETKTPETPEAPKPAGRNWYELQDIDPSEWTQEEAERIARGEGPTAEETAEWNRRQTGEVAAEEERKQAEEARLAEEKKTEIISRVKQYWQQLPSHSFGDVANKLRNMGGDLNRVMKASEYSRESTAALGIPERHAYLAKILDRLGVKVHLLNTPFRDGDSTPAAYYEYTDDPNEPGRVVFAYQTIARVNEEGRGHPTAWMEESMVHEFVHAITRRSGKWNLAEPKVREFWYELLKHKASAPKEISHYFEHIEKQGMAELVSMVFSEPRFAQWLDSIPSTGVKNESKTLWGKLKDAILRIIQTFGVPKSKLDEINDILDRHLLSDTIEAGGRTPTPAGEIRDSYTYGPISKMKTVPLSRYFMEKIKENAGKPINNAKVREWIAEAYYARPADIAEAENRGNYDHKAVQEAFEYAIVKTARNQINQDARQGRVPPLDYFVKLYENQPILGARTSESTIMQQYSTPLPIAWLMNKYLGMNSKKNQLTVYEPSAGNGMLLIGANPSLTIANELDKGNRLSHLRDMIGDEGGKVFNEDAIKLNPPEKSVDRVVANPPFGKAVEARDYDGYKIGKLDHQIVAESLKTMKDNGKAAFILGGFNKTTGPDATFLNFLYNNYNVSHNIEIPGTLYARQGTSFPVRLVTIEGRKATPGEGVAVQTGIARVDSYEQIDKILGEKYEGVKPEGEGRVEEGGKGVPPAPPVVGPAGETEGAVRAGEGEGRGPTGEGAVPGAELGGGERPTGPEGREGTQPVGGPGGRPGVAEPTEGVAVGPEEGREPRGPVKGDTDVESSTKTLEDIADNLDLMPKKGKTFKDRMAFETDKEEKNYEILKPQFEKVTEDVLNEVGTGDVSPAEVVNSMKQHFTKPGLFEKLTKYIVRFFKEEYKNLVARLRDAVMFQVKYIPRSAGFTDGTVCPRNQADAMQAALDRIVEQHGDIDEYVQTKLNYPTKEDLYNALSAEQIDAVAMIIDSFDAGGGFIIGDQTGVGKGRVNAAVIRYANLKGKIPIFVTANAGLFSDMVRDLKGIDHDIKPFIMNRSSDSVDANIYNKDTGELLTRANSTEGKGPAWKSGKIDWNMITANPDEYMRTNGFGVVFTTYTQHNDSATPSKGQDYLLNGMIDGNYIAMDESHTAAGDSAGGNSNTKLKFLRFIRGAAGVLYSSATYAKTPHNNAIYYRTAIGDTGMHFDELVAAINAGGNPLQEYMSNALTKLGQMLRREMDWTGITFNFTDNMASINKEVNPNLYKKLEDQYKIDKKYSDEANMVVRPMIRFSKDLLSRNNRDRLRNLLRERYGVDDVGSKGQRMEPSRVGFSNVVHNFSSQLLMAIKADNVLSEAKLAIDQGKKPIINLMNTMGSFLFDEVEAAGLEKGDEIDFTYKSVLERAMRNTLRIRGKDAKGQPFEVRLKPDDIAGYMPDVYQRYQDARFMLDRYDATGLHASPIDYIKYELEKYIGGTVGEITGRDLYIEYKDVDGEIKTVVNERTKEEKNKAKTIYHFNNGDIKALIINRAGAEGISLHASATVKDKSPRTMLFLQPHHDITVFIQTAGRIFRKGYVQKPEYKYIQSDLPTEIRPAVVLQRKLASLKANTTSKQKGAETRSDIPDMWNTYGDEIVRNYLKRNKSVAVELGLIHNVSEDLPSGLNYKDVSGKITVLPVEIQKEFYGEIESDYRTYIQELDEKGENKLASKNYDLRAKSLKKNELHIGPDPDNPFTGNVNVETLDVRVLRRPHNTAKIKELVKENLGQVTVAERNDELAENIGQFFEWQEEHPGEQMQMVVGQPRTPDVFNTALRNRVSKAVKEYMEAWRSTIMEKYQGDIAKVQDAVNEKMYQLAQDKEIYKQWLNKFKIGHTYRFPIAPESKETFVGVLNKITWEKPVVGVNPIQPSRLKFVFSVNSPIQTRIISASHGWFLPDADHEQAGIPENWDHILPTNKRENRVIVTGNMLRAINVMQMLNETIYQSGNKPIGWEMINFSRDNGDKEFGLLISRQDEDRLIGMGGGLTGRHVNWKDAYDYLSDPSINIDISLSSVNGEIIIQKEILPDQTSTYIVSTAKKKHIGGKYYQDTELLKHVKNNNFRSYGLRMVANVDPEKLKGFLQYLGDKHGMLFIMPQTVARGKGDKESPLGKFYVADRNGQIQEVQKGREIQIPGAEWMKAFVWKNPDRASWQGQWGVYERTTGRRIGHYEKSEKRAISWAEIDMKNKSREEWEKLLSDSPKTPYGEELQKQRKMPVELKESTEEETGADQTEEQPWWFKKQAWFYSDEPAADTSSPWYFKKQATMPIKLSDRSLLPKEAMSIVKDITDRFHNEPTSISKEDYDTVKSFLKTQNDFQMMDKYLGLPWWNAKKYWEWAKAFNIFGIERPENRGRFMHMFVQIAEPFFTMKETLKDKGYSKDEIEDAKDRIQRVIVTGDALLGKELRALRQEFRKMKADDPRREEVRRKIEQRENENRYSDEELLEGIKDDRGKWVKLNPDEIEIYKSVRTSLDTMFDTFVDHLQTMAFRQYKRQKWYAILTAAAGMDISKEATLRLVGSGLERAALLKAVKLQPDIQKIFERVEQYLVATPQAEKEKIADLYEKISNAMTQALIDVKKVLSEITGEKDETALNKMTKELFHAYLATRPELKRIKALRNVYRKQVAFFPRVREQGPFKMRLMEQIYNDEGLMVKEVERHMEMFHRKSDWKDVYKGILERWGKDGKLPDTMRIDYAQSTTTPEFAFQGVNDINMQKVLDDAIEGTKIKDDYYDEKGNKISVKDNLKNLGYLAIAKQFQSRGWGRHMIHRQWNVVKGYEENDLQTVLKNYLVGMSGLMTKQIAASDFLDFMKEVKNPKMFTALAQYGRDQLRNQTRMDRLSNKVRAFMFTLYLGGVIRPALVQMSQNFVTGMPKHAQYLREHGLGGAGIADKQYMTAMKDVFTKNYTPEERKMQDELLIEGITMDQYIRQIFGGLGTEFDQQYLRVLRWLAGPFSLMEIKNRQFAALTRFRPAYKMALERGLSKEEAYDEAFNSAREFVYDTHYPMTPANLPQIAQGEGFGVAVKTAYTFKQFVHNFVLQMKKDLSDGDWKTVMHQMAWIFMWGGLAGLPFFTDLFDWIERQFGFGFKKSIRKSLNSAGGRTLEDLGINGIPGMFGVNLSGSLALGIPFVGEDSLQTLGGVYEGQLQKLAKAKDALARGDLYRATINIVPEVLRGPRVAMEESELGKKLFDRPGYASTERGRPIYDETGRPLAMGPGEATVRSLGFQPTGFARQKEMGRSIEHLESWVAEKKRDAAETYRVAVIQKDPGALKDLVKSVTEINQGIKSRGIEKLVPPARISTIIQQSREKMTSEKRRELGFKQSEY